VIRQVVILAGTDAVGALDPFLGLPLIKRVILTMNRCGVTRAFVATEADSQVALALAADADFARQGVDLSIATLDDIRATAAGPVLVARADEVYSDALIRLAATQDLAGADAIRCGGLVAATSFSFATEGVVPEGEVADAAAFWHRPDSPRAVRRAENELLESLVKPTDGPVARNILRRLSLPLTRHLCKTQIKPNHMTVFASSLGFLGAVFIAQATWQALAIGGVLIFLQSVFDHNDGELARLKFQGSEAGAWLDHISDDVLSTTYALAFGWAAAGLTGQPIWWSIGIASAIGISIFHAVHYAQLAFVNRSGDPFGFRWWFQKDDVYLKTAMRQAGLFGRVVETFHATGRRDVYVFAFMVFSLARLPQGAVLWYFVVAMTHAVLSLVHVAAGGMARPPGGARPGGSARSRGTVR
jgi:phosphatidylglycerophosphate synthase